MYCKSFLFIPFPMPNIVLNKSPVFHFEPFKWLIFNLLTSVAIQLGRIDIICKVHFFSLMSPGCTAPLRSFQQYLGRLLSNALYCMEIAVNSLHQSLPKYYLKDLRLKTCMEKSGWILGVRMLPHFPHISNCKCQFLFLFAPKGRFFQKV